MIPLVTLMTPLIQTLAPKFLSTLFDDRKGPEFAEQVKDFVNSTVTPINEEAVPEVAKKQVTKAIEKIQSDPQLSEKMLSMMLDAERELTERHIQDLESARQFRLQSADDKQSARLLNLSFVLLGVIILVVVLMAFVVPVVMGGSKDKDVALQISGAVIGFLTGIGGMFARNIGSVFDFWFGSSAGSKAKSEQIATVLKTREIARPTPEPDGGAGKPGDKTLEELRDAFRKRMAAEA